MEAWRDIGSAPTDGREILVCNTRQGCALALVRWDRLHGTWTEKGAAVHLQATHWMPISPPPEPAC